MFSFVNRSSFTADALHVRPAVVADRAAIYDLTEHSHRVHFNLDWWTFDNWLYADRPSDAIWLAFDGAQLAGVLLAPYDDAPIAWLRSIAMANGYPAEPVMTALLQAGTVGPRAPRVYRPSPRWPSRMAGECAAARDVCARHRDRHVSQKRSGVADTVSIRQRAHSRGARI